MSYSAEQNSRVESDRWTGGRWLAVILVLGLGLRLYRLGALGLAGNEDYLAIAVRAVLDRGIPEFPSGVIYPRALPLAYLTAALAGIFGTGEFVLRLPSALFSTLSIGALYLLVRRLVSAPVALLAALLMALSDWEVQVGRTARMYSMLSAGTLVSVWLLDRALVRRDRRLGLAAAVATAITSWVHQLAVALGVMFVCLPLHLRLDRRRAWLLATALVTLVLAAGGYYLVNREQYAVWDVVVETARGSGWDEAPDARVDLPQEFQNRYLGPWLSLRADHRGAFMTLGAVAGGLIVGGMAAAARSRRELLFAAALALLAGALYLQQVALAALVPAAYALIGRQLQPEAYRPRALALAGLFALGGASWLLFSAVTTLGQATAGAGAMATLKAIVKPLVAYPPNFFKIYVEQYPAMSLLALCSAVVAVTRYLRSGRVDGLGLLALLFVVPTLFLGFHPQSIGRTVERYVYFLNPLFLGLAAAGAVWIGARIGDRLMGLGRLRPLALGAYAAALLVLTGGANLRASLACVTTDYGLNPEFRDRKTFDAYFHPDLAGPARFVDRERTPSDVVIAMDILGHHAYSPHVDYQLTLFGKPDAEGWLGAKSIGSVDELAETLDRNAGRRVWVVLAATHLRRLADDRRMAEILRLLEQRAGAPRYRGRDGLSDVYLVAPAG